MARLWTGKGDDGTSGLLHGGREPKHAPRFDAIGAVDEAQAALGVARAEVPRGSELDEILGLGPLAVEAITTWAGQEPGRALWQVGDRMYKVATVLHPLETQLADTNTGIETAR